MFDISPHPSPLPSGERGRVRVDKIDWFPLLFISSHGGKGRLLGKLF